jgi:hypothetical protein
MEDERRERRTAKASAIEIDRTVSMLSSVTVSMVDVTDVRMGMRQRMVMVFV